MTERPSISIADATAAVERLEAGARPPSAAGLTEAISSLEDSILGTDWATAEERRLAQSLVIRLSRLKRPAGCG